MERRNVYEFDKKNSSRFVKNKMIEAVVFDFDGVIADSLDFVLRVTNKYLKLWNRPILTKEYFRNNDIEKLYHSSRTNLLQEIFLLFKIRSEIHKNLAIIPIHKHIVPVLKKLSEKRKTSVLTSNSSRNVYDFLKVHQIHNYFLEIHGDLLMFNKDSGLKKIIKKYHLRNENVAYVGDEPRDVKAAKNIGAKSIAVDWGYSDRKLLESAKPDIVVSSSEELLSFIVSYRE